MGVVNRLLLNALAMLAAACIVGGALATLAWPDRACATCSYPVPPEYMVRVVGVSPAGFASELDLRSEIPVVLTAPGRGVESFVIIGVADGVDIMGWQFDYRLGP
jgi:hypothetical protein